MKEARILVVEDDADQRELIASILRSRKYLVAEADSLGAARSELDGAPVDLVLSDWKLPDGDGHQLLKEVRDSHPATAFVVVTAYGTIARAVEAIRLGADDYLAKPFERQALLLALESPFVAVNCAAVPEGLIEAEFFGVEKGAYTGADARRRGRFEAAAGGTLFLDEVGELPVAVQPKLLRVLQEGRYTRVGGTDELISDVRLIAATNRNLAEEVEAGRFRQDLFYRLNVVPLRMPALRERREDIPRLAEHFKSRAERRHGERVDPFPPPVMRRLLDHAWPGNVRELGNVVERLVLLAEDGRATLEDLPEELRADPTSAPTDGGFRLPTAGMSWEAHERSCLAQALELAAGNRARAARFLDLPYKAFLYRLDKHDL